MDLTWEPEALAALTAIVARGNAFSAGSGTSLGRQLKAAAEGAAERPFVGRKVPEFDLERMRERLVGPYRLIYFISDDGIEVISIVHGARDLRPPEEDTTDEA